MPSLLAPSYKGTQSAPYKKAESDRLIYIAIIALIFGYLWGLNVSANPQGLDANDYINKINATRILAENNIQAAHEQALDLQKSTEGLLNPVQQAKLLNLLARIEIYLADIEQGVRYAETALALAEANNDKAGQLEANLNFALTTINQGKINELKQVTERCMVLLEEVKQPDLVSEAMLRIGTMYKRLGKFDDSVTMAMRAMEMVKNSDNSFALTYAYHGLAVAYEQSQQYQNAIELYAKMQETAQKIPSKNLEAYALIGISKNTADLGDAKKGYAFLQQVLDLQRELGSPHHYVIGLAALAENFGRQQQYQEALKVQNEIIDIYSKYPHPIGLWFTYYGRSANYIALNNLTAAEADANEVYKLAKEINFTSYISLAVKRLAQLAQAKGDFKQAAHYLNKAIEADEQSAREKSGQRLLELAERFQSESKQREIDALTERNRQQAFEIKQRQLQQNLLLVVFIGISVLLLSTSYFFLRLGKSHKRLNEVYRDLQHSQTELRQQSALLRSILDNMGDGVVVANQSGSLMMINPAAEKMLQTSITDGTISVNDSAANYYLADMLTPYAVDDLPLTRAIQGQSCYGEEIYLVCKDTSHGKWLNVTARPLIDKDGATIGGVEVFSDITQRKRAEQEIRELNTSLEQRIQERTLELRQQARYMRTLIDMLPLWAWFKDTRNRYLIANQTYVEALGHNIFSIIGKSDTELWPNAIAADNLRDELEIMQTRARINREQYLPNINGGRWFETYKAAIIDLDGEVIGTVGVARDINLQKASEAAKEQALVEAKRLAQMRSDFLAQMSHELRTPLNGILGYAQILIQDQSLNPRQHAYVNVIYQSGEHLLTLISDILDYSKIEAGKLELILVPLQLEKFLRIIASIIRLRAEDKGLLFTLELADNLPKTILSDDKRLRQVLLNLLANAVKFTDTGNVTLRVSCTSEHLLRFEVQDTGIGIADNQLDIIFQPFEQSGEKLRHAGGTGLGLAISQHLVKKMGSKILVKSELNQGSLFWFDIAFEETNINFNTEAKSLGKIIGYKGPRKKSAYRR
ncbi:ATP-binding protein [Methylocucumis oryzae]|uniref:ATP-binding protein n=1 Tax=Methylocucumis oryzae TaxID=1632867 RepID=UPI00069758AD|nr:ATP-binding protein [Methylocucumis oryzae]